MTSDVTIYPQILVYDDITMEIAKNQRCQVKDKGKTCIQYIYSRPGSNKKDNHVINMVVNKTGDKVLGWIENTSILVNKDLKKDQNDKSKGLLYELQKASDGKYEWKLKKQVNVVTSVRRTNTRDVEYGDDFETYSDEDEQYEDDFEDSDEHVIPEAIQNEKRDRNAINVPDLQIGIRKRTKRRGAVGEGQIKPLLPNEGLQVLPAGKGGSKNKKRSGKATKAYEKVPNKIYKSKEDGKKRAVFKKGDSYFIIKTVVVQGKRTRKYVRVQNVQSA